MKSIRSSVFFRVLILAIGALGAFAGSACAQSTNGTFTLNHETRWGSAVLPAGNYAFSLPSPNLPAQLIVRKICGSPVAIVLSRMVSTEKLTEASRLVLGQSESGESFVSTLYLGDLGLGLHYATPKAKMPATETARLGPIANSQPGK